MVFSRKREDLAPARVGQTSRHSLAAIWREHLVSLLFFVLLAVLASWPTIRDFTTSLTGVSTDTRNNLWLLWHVRQFLAGEHQLFYTDLLYYPVGINLLLRGLGPFVGLLGLPFWRWGPMAAYNGALMLALALSGYTLYLLSRGIGLARGPAVVAGTIYFFTPIHLVGVWEHMTKSFVALMPLTLWALHHALDSRRSWWWAPATGLALLATLAHNGYQFVLLSLGMGVLVIAWWWQKPRGERATFTRRATVTAVLSVLICLPLLVALVRASATPGVTTTANQESLVYQPDLLQLFLPAPIHWAVGDRVKPLLNRMDVGPIIETSVSLSWVALILAAAALARGARRVRPWLVLAAFCVLMALGPMLKIGGQTVFTSYSLPIPLPYAWLSSLPPLDFMRTPGRFVLLGAVGLSLAAGFGLSGLTERWPRARWLFVGGAMLLAFVEGWPAPWTQQQLRPVPDFYQRIAADPAKYGVFDLPIMPEEDSWYIGYAANYQMYQMVHEKGLASGYVARAYAIHPLFPCIIPELIETLPQLTVNGESVACHANTRLELAAARFRYIVAHKPLADDPVFAPEHVYGQAQSDAFLDLFFAGETPIVDDNLVTVYAVEPLPDGLSWQPNVHYVTNWYAPEAGHRWARSPATLAVTVPTAQDVELAILPVLLFDRETQRLGAVGEFMVTTEDGGTRTVPVRVDETAIVPLSLPAGKSHITISLGAGNFRPRQLGMGRDNRRLSFAIQSIDLRLAQP